MLQLKLERRGENEAAVDRSTESEAKIRKESLDINANVVSSGPCFFCGQQTELLCRFCQGVYYCSEVTSRDCQLKYKDSVCVLGTFQNTPLRPAGLLLSLHSQDRPPGWCLRPVLQGGGLGGLCSNLEESSGGV